jgi:uncharacterized protein (TIGR02588 family)
MSGRSRRSQQRNGLEWAVFGVGALLVAAVVGYLAYDALAGTDGPADLRVELGTPARAGHVVVPVHVRNVGGRSAEEVVVEVCAGGEASPEDCAEVTFPFVPHGATREGVVGFAAPPAGPLRSRVVSYREA